MTVLARRPINKNKSQGAMNMKTGSHYNEKSVLGKDKGI